MNKQNVARVVIRYSEGFALRKLLMAMALLCAASTFPGCVSQYTGQRMIAPPNGGRTAIPVEEVLGPWFADSHYMVTVGPPEAHLVYFVVEPKPMEVWTSQNPDELRPLPWEGPSGYRIVTISGDERGELWHTRIAYPIMDGKPPMPPGDAPVGTIILLQGWGGAWTHDNGHYLWHIAAILANAGYRLVLPDLRGHGQSSGDFVAWGDLESRDMAQLIDDLEDRDLLAGILGIVGHSYGALVAMNTARRDDRVQAIVALSLIDSTESLPIAIRAYWRQQHPYQNLLLGWLLTDRMLTRAIQHASTLADFDPAELAPVKVIQFMNTPVLLVHGIEDENCPVTGAQAVYEARSEGTWMVLYEDEDHWSFLVRRFENFQDTVLTWLEDQAERQADAPVDPLASFKVRYSSFVGAIPENRSVE